MPDTEFATIPLDFQTRPIDEIQERSAAFRKQMDKRRTVRDFADTAVPGTIIRNAIAVANSAPSGAHMQPWFFVAIQSQELKSKIRLAAEKEERELYEHRASPEWLDALAPLGTDADKPFLEKAPWLIAVFAQKFTIDEDCLLYTSPSPRDS